MEKNAIEKLFDIFSITGEGDWESRLENYLSKLYEESNEENDYIKFEAMNVFGG